MRLFNDKAIAIKSIKTQYISFEQAFIQLIETRIKNKSSLVPRPSGTD